VGQVQQLNSYVTCTDIWAGTPLSICVPSLRASDPQACTQTYTSAPGDTCGSVAAAHGTSAQWIKAWNAFLDCTDIWTGTSVCVRH
jgi:LysM repeat protein